MSEFYSLKQVTQMRHDELIEVIEREIYKVSDEKLEIIVMVLDL